MTTTVNANGRARKSLTDQIDRLDSIVDGLAQGLNEAVADAVREAVGLAVQEAVVGALGELLANPTLLDRLRASLGLTAPLPTAPVARISFAAGRLTQARTWLGAGWRVARRAYAAVAGRVQQVLAAAHGCWRLTRQFRIPVLMALGISLLAACVTYFGGPCVAALAGWVAGFLTTLAAEARFWLRRTFGALGAPDT